MATTYGLTDSREELAKRLERRLCRWRDAGEIPAYQKLKYLEPFKPQVKDKRNNRFNGEMGAYSDSQVVVPGVEYINASPLDILDKEDILWIATMCPKVSCQLPRSQS